MVQHYIGFADARTATGITVRYVVADPGSWLYLDAVRPYAIRDGKPVELSDCVGGADYLGSCSLSFKLPVRCPAKSDNAKANNDDDETDGEGDAAGGGIGSYNHWKYGTERLHEKGTPGFLGRSAVEAKARYAGADITYLQGAEDTGKGKGTAYRVLDKSCAAALQGPFRLQRGLAYALYDRTHLAPAKQRKVIVVPTCAHEVACVFPKGHAALLGSGNASGQN